jgi:colicin import membrane protein
MVGRGLPWFYSIALHVVLFVLLSISFAMTRLPVPPAGVAIQATVVDEARIQKELENLNAADRKRAEDAKRQAERADAARRAREQEEKRLAALAEERRKAQEEQAQKAQEARKQQEELEAQRLADEEAARKRRQEREAQERAEKERLAKLEEQRKAEEERLAAIEKERAEAEARAKKEADARKQRELEAQLKADLAREDARRQAERSGLLAQYVQIIAQKVERNWARPPSAVSGLSCDVRVTQIPGGEVVDVRVVACTGDAAVVRSIEAAVYKSSPLPPPPDPSLFERELLFKFEPE